MTSDTRQQLELSQQTTELLVLTIMQIAGGFAEPREVTAVLRRVCDESSGVLPEVLLLRIKELWAKATRGDVGGTRTELDHRYASLIGECLALYHGRVYRDPVRQRNWVKRDAGGCGEPDVAPPAG
jgi:hypothetical protein